MIVNGRLQLDIFKNIDGKKVKIDSFDDDNKITLSGKQVMAFLMAGEPGSHKISKFGVGTGTSFPDDYDTGLTNAVITDLVGYRFLEDTVVQWDFAVPASEAVGLDLAEFGLYSEDEQLFARKIRTPAFTKDASMSLSGQWTVWLLECRKTTFSAYVVIEFAFSTPAFGFTNEIAVNPVIAHSVISDGNADRIFAAQADIVFDATSNPNSEQIFTSNAGIVSSISAPIITFTNVERRFTSTSDIQFITSVSAIVVTGRFENLFADIVFQAGSDIDV